MELLDEPAIWEALLPDMPLGALVGDLDRPGRAGLLTDGSSIAADVVRRLADREAMARARIHPVRILLARKTCARNIRTPMGRVQLHGSWEWPSRPSASAVVDALDEAFDRSFASVRPTGRRILLCLALSQSRGYTRDIGSPALSAIEAAAIMAMIFVRTEPQAEVVAFDRRLHAVPLGPEQRFEDMLRLLGGLNRGTDMALPFRHALERRSAIDAIVTVSDSHTWAGRRHTVQALARYRETVNPQARTVVLATAIDVGSLVPDDDPLSMGCAGFDTAVPELVSAFIEGAGREQR